MNWEQWFMALCYELAIFLISKRPKLAFAPWMKLLLLHCKPFWAESKTEATLKEVDRQAEKIVAQWKQNDREVAANNLASEAQLLFPKATVTPLPNAPVPSVLIEHEIDQNASDGVKALGGAMQISRTLTDL
jgi:hypothetical protein